jgi:hypothetical protein
VSPTTLIAAGVFCLLLGWALLFLMVLRIIPPSFALALGAYTVSLGGLVMGLAGLLQAGRSQRM